MGQDEIVREFYKALMVADADALNKYVVRDVIVREPPSLPFGGDHHGIDAMLSVGRQIFQESFEFRSFDILTMTKGGDVVVATVRTTGVARATGKEVDITAAEVFRFQADKIAEIQTFWFDSAGAIAALEA